MNPIVLSLYCILTILQPTVSQRAIAMLKNRLLQGYDKSFRPVKNEDNKTTVGITFYPRYLDFVENGDFLIVHASVFLVWKDEFLNWDTKAYKLTYINLSTDEIWVPDLSVYNSGFSRLYVSSQPCYVYSTGLVYTLLITQFRAHCIFDLLKWPYDTQICTVTIGSRTWMGQYLDFKFLDKTSILKNYLPNQSWQLKTVSFTKNITTVGNTSSYLVSLTYRFTLSRYSSSLTATITIPAIVLVTMVLLSFWMHPGQVERFILVLISSFSHLSYLQYVGNKLPSNAGGNVLIVNFFRDSLLMCFWTLFLCAAYQIILSNQRTPYWLQGVQAKIFNFPLTKIIMFSMNNPASKSENEEDVNLVKESNPEKQALLFFVALIDRIHFVIFIFIYVIMASFMLP